METAIEREGLAMPRRWVISSGAGLRSALTDRVRGEDNFFYFGLYPEDKEFLRRQSLGKTALN